MSRKKFKSKKYSNMPRNQSQQESVRQYSNQTLSNSIILGDQPTDEIKNIQPNEFSALTDKGGKKKDEKQQQQIQKKQTNKNLISTKELKFEQQGHAEELNPNVIKNVMRQFFNFVLTENNQDVVLEFLKYKNYDMAVKYTKRIMREFKFNNTYIIRLISKKGYCKLLEYYLTLEIQEWLQKAKIKDISQHLRCIEFLKECCVDKEKLQTIIKYKKKN